MLTFLLLTGLWACAQPPAGLQQQGRSGEAQVQFDLAPPPQLLSQLPPLPPDAPLSEGLRLGRRGSLVGKSQLWGNQYFSASPASQSDDIQRSLALLPAGGDFSWALYRFEALVDSDKPNLLTIDLDSAALPASYWVAIADYGLQRWRILPVSVPIGEDNVGIQPQWQPLSAAGNLYAAVLCSQPAAIEQLTLSLGTLAPPPTELTASDGTRASRIVLSWNNTGVVPDQVIVERASDPRGPYLPIATLLGAALNYSDLYDPVDDPMPYAVPLYYRLRSRVDGKTGAASLSDSGFRLLASPAGLSASAGLFEDRVELNWEPVQDADGYALEYRRRDILDDPWHPLTSLSGNDSLSFEHSLTQPEGREASPLTLYDYNVSAVFFGDRSLISEAVTGYLTIPAVTNLSASDGLFHDKVLLQWDVVEGVEGYVLEYRISEAAEELWTELVRIGAAGTNSFAHSFDAPLDRECRLGETYAYRARALLSERESRDNSNVDTGFRLLAGPTDLQASDGTHSDHIALTWTPNPLADGYRVYRFGEPEPVAELGPVASYDDFGSCSIVVHQYELRSMFAGEEGSAGSPDEGYRNRVQSFNVQLANGGGHYCSALVVEGLPAIAYWQEPTGELRYSRALEQNPQGPDDWVTTVVDTLNPVGSNTMLAFYKNRPVIAYGTHSSSDINVAYASVTQPSLPEHWTTAIVDSGGFTGLSNLTVAEANSRLVLVYLDAESSALRWARAKSAQPTDLDFEFHNIDERFGAGRFPSLIINDNVPSVSYYNESGGTLCYARSTRADPFAMDHWVLMDIDNQANDVGVGSRLTLLNGLPAVAYIDATAGSLLFASAATASPSVQADWTVSTVVSGIGSSANCSAALLDGLPQDLLALSFYDSGQGQLRLARALTELPAGPGDWLLIDLDTQAGDVGIYNSVVADGCVVGAGYRMVSANQLRFVQGF